jgi:hypothetical protein
MLERHVVPPGAAELSRLRTRVAIEINFSRLAARAAGAKTVTPDRSAPPPCMSAVELVAEFSVVRSRHVACFA